MQIPRNNYVQTTLLSTPCVGWCACDTTQLEATGAGAYQDVRAPLRATGFPPHASRMLHQVVQ